MGTHTFTLFFWAVLLLWPTLAASSSTTEATYAYDALDRRIARTVDGVVTAYVYDMSPYEPLAYDDITLEFTDGILTRRWAHSDAVDEPLGFEAYVNQSGVGSGAEHAIYADRQGSVIWVTDPATGAVVAGYEYDAYGRITQTTGTLAQPYGYTGREYDAESGLYHYRARAYDPESGVFLQVDPVEFGGGLFNLQSYVGANPTKYTDASGLQFGNYSGQAVREAADTVANTTYISVGVAGLAGSIASAISQIQFGDWGAEWHRNKGKFVPTGTGDCSPSQHAVMQAAVDALKEPSACKALPSSAGMINVEKMRQFSKLAIARTGINAACFRGGDAGHNQAVADALAAMELCRNLIIHGRRKP